MTRTSEIGMISDVRTFERITFGNRDGEDVILNLSSRLRSSCLYQLRLS